MAVSAEMVKKLREETGAAVLDCKKALEQYNENFDEAKKYLAEKGLATARKKSEREAREGLIETYGHPGGRVGVMLELNCETDFVASTDQFQELAHDLALHIAFANPQYLDVADVSEEIVNEHRKEFESEAKAQGKPDNVIDRIVEGRMNKVYAEICLLQQSFVKDDEKTINDIIVEAIAALKENIRVNRFARFEIGDIAGQTGEEDNE
ncbi:MAG: elongation factor Ts [Anaerolineae bacterium]|nr:elongation factor Ts [Anaerolineae bacterium]